jgi:hypothetical protein
MLNWICLCITAIRCVCVICPVSRFSLNYLVSIYLHVMLTFIENGILGPGFAGDLLYVWLVSFLRTR